MILYLYVHRFFKSKISWKSDNIFLTSDYRHQNEIKVMRWRGEFFYWTDIYSI